MDYEASPECTNMEINVVRFSDDYWAIPEEETAHLDFGPRKAIFQKPKDLDNHLKALYLGGISMGSQFLVCLWTMGQL